MQALGTALLTPALVPVEGLFDLIIGSDLLYDREQPEALSQFIDRHSATAVEVVIAEVMVQIRDDGVAANRPRVTVRSG